MSRLGSRFDLVPLEIILFIIDHHLLVWDENLHKQGLFHMRDFPQEKFLKLKEDGPSVVQLMAPSFQVPFSNPAFVLFVSK